MLYTVLAVVVTLSVATALLHSRSTELGVAELEEESAAPNQNWSDLPKTAWIAAAPLLQSLLFVVEKQGRVAQSCQFAREAGHDVGSWPKQRPVLPKDAVYSKRDGLRRYGGCTRDTCIHTQW